MTRTFLANSDIPRAWWKSAVVYQIYPASFCDSNGDGIGDLKGIISKLDYLENLGIDVIWLSPIFKSPQNDMGYDISDYRDIHAPYGSVEDVDTLISQLHKRDMKLVLDLVVNHTSDEHDWFRESRSSKTSPKRDWYIWRPAKYDAEGKRRPPNNWQATFGGSVWEWDEGSQEYFLHLYDPSQPDLNFESDEMRAAVYDMMKFWLDKGCDGYRMDVIGRISKDPAFHDAPIIDPASEWQDFARVDGPRLHEFLQEMNQQVLSKYDIMTVGELNKVTPQHMLKFSHPDRHEINQGFCFDHVNIGLGVGLQRFIVGPWELKEFKDTITRWQWMREAGAWHALYLENHDQPRSISRYASDMPQWRYPSGKMLAMMHTTLFGTVYIYQGQEIGMINLPQDWPLEEWKDVQTQNVVKIVRNRGANVEQQTRDVYFKARDNARSPMQWNDELFGGFSTASPWMRIPDDYKNCNVAAQEDDPDSLLTFWREMLHFRKKHTDVLVYGSYRVLSPDDNTVFAYVRDESILVVLNFTDAVVEYSFPEDFSGGKLLKATTETIRWPSVLEQSIEIAPYSGAVYQLVA